jgi:hypothetical protein
MDDSMIALTDDELSAVMDACKPLRPGDRDPFLRALAQELRREPQLGPVAVWQVGIGEQRRRSTNGYARA